VNSIHVIHPYKSGSVWVFDDDRVGLRAEPFVGGATEIIDRLTCDLPDADSGFTLIFSATPFRGYQHCLKWVREEFGGNTYRVDQWGMDGWLCPALFKYFDQAPSEIYVATVLSGRR
jgi:hypothetical protein